MRLLEDAVYKMQYMKDTYEDPNKISNPQICKLQLPIKPENVTELDKQLIQVLISYKQEVEKNLEDNLSEEFYEQQSEPSDQAKELKSFIYDHLDDFEEVLDEDDYDELESLMMNIG